ncbi:A24 family peptidase [Paraburkholderia bryophila]|uniref:Prepilin peptidase CpaA n=1 Tax=Paraburkholderia bryophila TaxID=420952 RepID=A0A329BQT7_9BURK|nr:prepilin peptidase [Paraburkholderia bryophila]RAS24260.1 prepilin peptidase CpaA [Paraburkholderia bryophila]
MKVFLGVVIFVAWAVVVAVCDYRRRRIPNSVVVAGFVAAFGCALVQSGPFGVSLTQALTGALIGLVALLPFFALGVMGAGDVKVFAVLGAWCGMHALLGLWMAASLAAGIHALWLLTVTRTRLADLGRDSGPTFEVVGKASTPFAACLTIAASGWLGLQVLSGGLR